MKIEGAKYDNVAYNSSNNQNAAVDSKTSFHKKDRNKTNNVIYAGNLKINNNTAVAKKQQANKKALQAIMDQFKKDQTIDNNIESLKTKQDEFAKEAKMAADQIADLNVKKEDLKQIYGISDDSEEQKDLGLLEKSLYSPEELSEEEYNKLKDMGPLTDYQKEALKYDAMQNLWKERAANAANGIVGINMSISSIKLELLKYHPMVDAQKEAMKIIEEAIKEVLGTLTQQSKETIDDKMEENKEKIEESQKEQEQKDSESGNLKTNSLPASDQTDQLQLLDELKKFSAEQNLLDDDLKGIKVDEQV